LKIQQSAKIKLPCGEIPPHNLAILSATKLIAFLSLNNRNFQLNEVSFTSSASASRFIIIGTTNVGQKMFFFSLLLLLRVLRAK
jgi:hypothetical protein